jgi:hypothetical protein
MFILQFFPLFAVVLGGYFALHMIGFFPGNLNVIIFHFQLPSGAVWKPTYGDLLIIVGIITLFIELFKSTRTATTSIIDHILSTFVLVGYLVIWMIYPWAGNSYVLILTMMSFLDVIAGFTITISTARRDLALGGS